MDALSIVVASITATYTRDLVADRGRIIVEWFHYGRDVGTLVIAYVGLSTVAV